MSKILFPLRHTLDLWLWHVAGIKHPDFEWMYESYTREGCISGLFWENLNEGWAEIEEQTYIETVAYGNPRVRSLGG